MTNNFGDAEPEDAWHPDDPVDVLLDNLSRRCTILGEPTQLRGDTSHSVWLNEIEARLHRLRQRREQMTELEQVRVELIEEDVDHLWERLT